MKYLAVLCLAGTLLSAACVNHQPAVPVHDSIPGTDPTEKNNFFPVADFLRTEILGVDSTPVALVRYRTSGHQTDSAFISPPEFDKLASQFLPSEVSDSALAKDFTESSFADKTTGSITFSYTPIDKDNALRRVDVQTAQGRQAQEVKNIYMETRRVTGDTVVLKKMLWAAKQRFQIVTLTNVKGGEQLEQQLKVVWGDRGTDQ
jgi:hypothetical protein